MIADEMKDLWTEKRYEEFLRLGVEQPEIAQVVLGLFTFLNSIEMLTFF